MNILEIKLTKTLNKLVQAEKHKPKKYYIIGGEKYKLVRDGNRWTREKVANAR